MFTLNIEGLRSHRISWVKKTIYCILVLVMALFIFIDFLQVSGLGKKKEASFDKVITGTAYRPFAYRVFLPIVANILSPVVPKRIASRLVARLDTIVGDKIVSERFSGSSFPRQVVIILMMMYLSLVGFIFVIWRFVKELGYSFRIQYVFPLLALAGCMIFFGFGYMYDLPVLFFFSMSSLLMFEKRWGWFLFVFACATLNKETSIFLFPIFALYFYNRMPGRQFIVLSASQIGIYGLIHGIVMFVFRNNPGSVVEWHFYDQIDYYKGIAQTTPLLLVWWMVAIAFITILVAYKWSYKPLFPRVALSMLPVFLILFVMWGFPSEIRGMLEVYPIVAILMLPPPV
ncbi:MAG: hypothetical protein M1485_01715 [Chloroflexi bacterium]|nr:hypothetical protein [Chloroflexota bacterium]